MNEPRNRFWDAFWLVGPLLVGGFIGLLLAGQFPGGTTACAEAGANPSTSANFTLAVALAALLVGRMVARSVIGPVAARAFTVATFGLVVMACGSYFVNVGSESCPPPATSLGSSHEQAVVWTSPAQLFVSG